MNDKPTPLPPDDEKPERITIRPADTGRRRLPTTQARPASTRRSPESESARPDNPSRNIISSRVPVMPRFDDPGPTPPAITPRRGCGLPLLGIALVVLPLIVLALFLPPFSLWSRLDEQFNGSKEATPSVNESVVGLTFEPLWPDSPRLTAEGLAVAVPPEDLTAPFSVHVAALSPSDYRAGHLPREGWFCAVSLPADYTLGSQVFSLAQQGTPPGHFTVSVTALSGAGTDAGALQLFVWDASAARWEFVTGGADDTGTITADLTYLPRCVTILRESDTARRLGLSLGPADQVPDSLTATQGRIFPGSLRPTVTGALQVVLPPGVQTRSGYAVLPLIQNFDDPAVIDHSTVEQILMTPTLRSEHARQIAAFALSDAYTGVAVDYRAVVPDLRDSYTAFITELADLLRGENRTLTVMVPVPQLDAVGAVIDTGGYDWHALGLAADEIVITAPLDPRAFVSGALVDQVLGWATTVVARNKLTLGLSASSVEEQNDTLVPVSLREAVSYLGDLVVQPSGDIPRDRSIVARLVNASGINAQPGYDVSVQTPYLRYFAPDGSLLSTMWITNAGALDAHIARARDHHLSGIFIRNTFAVGESDRLTEPLVAFRQGRVPDALTLEMDFRWVLVYSSTYQVAEVPTQPDQPFAYGQWPAEGVYTLGAWLEGDIVSTTNVTVVAASGPPVAVSTPVPTETTTPELLETPVELPTLTPLPTTVVPFTATSAPTQTPQPSATATVTTLPTDSPSPTLSLTPSVTSSVTPSTTPSVTPSATSTATLTPTSVPTRIIALLPSTTPRPPTLVPSATPTASETPTATKTAEPSATVPPTATALPTFTLTPPPVTLGPSGVEVVPLPGQPLTVVPTVTPLEAVPAAPTHEVDAIDIAALPTVDPAILAAGQIGTAFEAGVSITSLNESLLYVGRTHFTWIALDVRYQLGATPGALQRVIEDAHANGFKILLTVTGDLAEFNAVPRADYITQYAAYVNGLASYGADGIEVWREMNEQMPVADYVWLLALSYNAIKTPYPGVLVITGALAPTAASATLEQGDNVYYQRMAELGADRVADCVGAGYLLGAVSPPSTRGDPRGDNPVYYLPSSLDRAWNAFGNRFPVCYTRFGYLSPEGYAPLPDDYAWAQNTTAAQQAAWLTEAVQLSMQGSQVRLLIAWTLDAASLDADSPLAGYALVRPDATCPACDALAPLLETRGAGVE